MEALMKKAKDMIEKLDFDGCVKLFNQLPSGHPMIDLVFDRMEAIDPERFEEFSKVAGKGRGTMIYALHSRKVKVAG